LYFQKLCFVCGMADGILPVSDVCVKCGWACSSVPCGRCGFNETEDLKENVIPLPDDKAFLNSVNLQPPSYNYTKNKFLTGNYKMGAMVEKNSQKLRNGNRRSRALSRQFVNKVVVSKTSIAVPMPVLAENVGVWARPVVNSIVELTSHHKTEDGTLSVDAIEKLLLQEKLQGTPWREVADETIMELILNGLEGSNFIAALVNAYDISTYDVGLFLATPPDEETMSLIEELVCHDSLDLFQKVLSTDENLLQGVLQSKDTTEEVQKVIFNVLNDKKTKSD